VRSHGNELQADPISQTLVEFVGQVEDANTIHGHKWYELKLKSDGKCSPIIISGH
jgi:hypothetical protein